VLEIKEWNLFFRRCEFVSVIEKDSSQSSVNNFRHKLAELSKLHPDILWADDHIHNLGADNLVFETLKKQSRRQLVIVTTMNESQAKQWTSRQIYFLDGVIIEDTAPLSNREIQLEKIKDQYETEKFKLQDKPSKSFGTSFSLSLTSLIKQKGWTALILFLCIIGVFVAVILLTI